MNSLFNAALKQSAAVRRDLDTFAESPTSGPAALQGQISASLTSFSRTIDDYSSLSKKELIPAKQEKAFERVKNFRTELADYRLQFDRLRKEREEAQVTANRNELLGRRPHNAATPENPYAQSNLSTQHSAFASPHRQQAHASGGLSFGASPSDYNRETHALREQSFLANTNNQIDEFLDRGRAVLADLGQQREMLKGTQRRLYSVANTLGSNNLTKMYDQAYLHSYEKAIVYNNGDVTATCINMRYCLNTASSLPQEKRVVIYDSSYEHSIKPNFKDEWAALWPLSGQSLMERLCCRASVPFKGRLSPRINWGYAGFGPISHKRENAATLFKDESPAE
ncbi:TPA_exp: hypothetical protein A8136_1635 [Trichophyton benhamiae CBS 112371]|nr:TPA_exp: hypothetical protein A8136_1635 [Trichophyton benhamiae CBS 112371]